MQQPLVAGGPIRGGGGMRGARAAGGGGGMAGGGPAFNRSATPGGAVIQADGRARGVEEYDSASSGEASFAGAWIALMSPAGQTNAPQALYQLMRAARREIGLPAALAAWIRLNHLVALDTAADLKVLVLSSADAMEISDEIAAALGAYVQQGGFIIVDGGNEEFRARVLAALTSSTKGTRRGLVRTDHAIFVGKSMPFRLTEGPFAIPADGLWVGDRLAVFASAGPLVEPWSDPTAPEAQPALELGVNLLAYALQHAR